MDNAQKAIMIGVGLFITIIIISAVLLITNLGTGLIIDAQSQLGNISTSLQNTILQSYDGKVMSGTEVLAAARQYENSTEITVTICNFAQSGNLAANSEGVTGVLYLGSAAVDVNPNEIGLTGGITTTTATEDVSDDNMDNYTDVADVLNTRGTYRCSYVMEQITNNVIGIAFIQLGENTPTRAN